LLPVLLGPGWAESGEFLAALAIGAATGLVVSPLSIVFVLYQRALMNVALDVGRIVVVGGLGVIAWLSGTGAVAAVILMSCGMGTVYIAIWLLGLRTASSRARIRSKVRGKEGIDDQGA
jgi:O-antigen/teichoic acid export membrane protein